MLPDEKENWRPERGIEQSRKDLGELEEALKARRYPAAVKGGGLHRRLIPKLEDTTTCSARRSSS
jgi:hypothetical protein